MDFLKVLEFIKKEEANIDFDQNINVSILRNHTVDNVIPYLKYNLFKAKIKPEFTIGEYNNMVQEVINPTSNIYENSPKVIVVRLTQAGSRD